MAGIASCPPVFQCRGSIRYRATDVALHLESALDLTVDIVENLTHTDTSIKRESGFLMH